jgi:hypothetical protein
MCSSEVMGVTLSKTERRILPEFSGMQFEWHWNGKGPRKTSETPAKIKATASLSKLVDRSSSVACPHYGSEIRPGLIVVILKMSCRRSFVRVSRLLSRSFAQSIFESDRGSCVIEICARCVASADFSHRATVESG